MLNARALDHGDLIVTVSPKPFNNLRFNMVPSPPMAERTAVARMTISADEAGQRLDNYVARHFRHLPRSVIYRLIRRGEVRVNGGRRQAKARLAAGDEVRLPPVSAPDPRHTPAAGAGLVRGLADRVLFESPHLLVLDKPSGLAVHGGSGVNLGVIEVLRQARSDRFLELVHRLDRDTSGCLAIARSRSALRLLQQAFRDRTVRKRYRVLVRGCWPDARTTVTAPLERYVTASGERRVRVSPAGQASRTDFERITLGDGYTELVAHLHTGRTHQIRVHAASHGHPVLGDDKYGRVEDQERWSAQGLNQLALHAERLRLPDPAGGLIDVSAPLPARFARLGALAAAGTATEQGSEPRR